MSQVFDVIVVGLGGMGSAAAYHLAARGSRVLGLERFSPPHDRGSSHGRSRVIRQAYFEGAAYVPLLLRAYELWERIERDAGVRILTVTGGLMVGSRDGRVVEGSIRSARAHGLAHEILDASEIRRRFPPLTPAPGDIALYENRAGFVDPEESIRAHLGRAAALGATFRFEEEVLSWEALSDDGVVVRATSGVFEAGRLVLAPGPWAPRLLADLGLPLAVERQVLYWFEPTQPIDAFRPDRFPIYIWETEPGREFYGFPAQQGPPGGVKVAFFREGEPADPERPDRVVRAEEVERMRDALRDRIPSLGGRLIHAATCFYTTTPDHAFVLGLHPRHRNVAVASPCSGHGFKFASVVGEILADLAREGSTRHPIDIFDPSRFS